MFDLEMTQHVLRQAALIAGLTSLELAIVFAVLSWLRGPRS